MGLCTGRFKCLLFTRSDTNCNNSNSNEIQCCHQLPFIRPGLHLPSPPTTPPLSCCFLPSSINFPPALMISFAPHLHTLLCPFQMSTNIHAPLSAIEYPHFFDFSASPCGVNDTPIVAKNFSSLPPSHSFYRPGPCSTFRRVGARGGCIGKT